MSISEKVQLTYTTILEHFVNTGHAPHYTELAEMLDMGIDELANFSAKPPQPKEWDAGCPTILTILNPGPHFQMCLLII